MITKTEWKNIRGSSPVPDQIMLSVKGNPSSNMAVRWRTDTQADSGFVKIREKDSTEWRIISAQSIDFETDMDFSRFHFADLSGLSEDTFYEYNCGDEKNRSENYVFKTTKKDCTKFSFLCISDVQAGDAEPPADYSALNTVLKETLKKHPQCEFILTAGDNTNCGQTDIQWTGLFEGLKGIIESKPIMFCMGNHDDMGFENYFTKEGKYYSEYAEYFTNQLWGSYEHNGPKDRPVANYAFDYGNVHFCVTGTSGYEEMNEWLVDQMKNSDKTWKFAVHHFPVNYSSPVLEIEDTYPALREGMDMCDIVFSGHEHTFARSYPRRGEGLFDKPSEGTIHYNLGSSHRNSPGARVVNKVWNVKTYCHEEPLSMYSVVDIDDKKCTLTAYVEDGRVVDVCVIDKNKDNISPADLAPIYDKTRLLFKGYDLGICTLATLPQKVNGVWYIPIGQIISFTGANVERAPGKIKVSIYGRTSEFTENSNIIKTQSGEEAMSSPCLRLEQNQLYVPLDDFGKNLRMHGYYYEHNNFISIESEVQHLSIPHQP
ncbi:MAG: hypothetical protein E7533_01105 [Ruminococcaceae bacterium]|nr:hypothetical protein [Oscillospiraceae bacterium]